jgi:transposase-like protein
MLKEVALMSKSDTLDKPVGAPMKKVDKIELTRMLKEGKTQAEIARHFGVSRPCISNHCKNLREGVNRHAAMELAPAIVKNEMDIVKNHSTNYKRLETLLADVENEDDSKLRLATLAEMRKHIQESRNMARDLIDISEVRGFQKRILEILGEVSPEAKREFIRRVQAERLLRKSVERGDK